MQVLGARRPDYAFPLTCRPAFRCPFPEDISGESSTATGRGLFSGFTLELLTGGYAPQDLLPDIVQAHCRRERARIRIFTGWSYELRPDVPRRFKTQVVSPDNEVTEEDCAQKFMLSSGEILRAIAPRCKCNEGRWKYSRTRLNMDFTNAVMDADHAAKIAFKVLTKNESFDARELRRSLLRKLKATLRSWHWIKPTMMSKWATC